MPCIFAWVINWLQVHDEILKYCWENSQKLIWFLAILSHTGWGPVAEMLTCPPVTIRNC